MAKTYAHPEVLVSADWVEEHLKDPRVRVVESDEDILLYDLGHIPGAVRIDWQGDLQDQLLRDYINATVGFPKLAAHTRIHVKTLHQMFGPHGNPTARKLSDIVAYLQRAEGVRYQVRLVPALPRARKRTPARRARRAA